MNIFMLERVFELVFIFLIDMHPSFHEHEHHLNAIKILLTSHQYHNGLEETERQTVFKL